MAWQGHGTVRGHEFLTVSRIDLASEKPRERHGDRVAATSTLPSQEWTFPWAQQKRLEARETIFPW
jgi:hypothetical protein